ISEKLGMDGIEGAYPVRRQDAALILCGTKQNDFLSQTCNVNFAEMDEKKRQVVMTNMVGVSVVMVQNKINERYSWKIWCDGTFGHYFWETLFGITLEMGGGAVGCNRLYPGLA
ncbi:MAG: hypothetical protein KGL58_06460, partial [Pseudomonadota bacterium]|nr:hypothetical protein [Pseudomonadota bacterium]